MRFKSSRALLALVAVFAMSAVAASAASATTPEFKPVPVKKKLTGAGGSVTWKFGAETMTCAKSIATGEITGARTIGKTVMTFTGCKVTGVKKEGCAVKSVGAKEGEILTKSLSGELGKVRTAEAPSGVGLLLKPETGKTWTNLVANECTVETPMTGTVAAEVPVIGKKQVTNKLIILDPSGKQAIKEIALDSGKNEKPSLTMWSATVTVETTDELTFEEALEVT